MRASPDYPPQFALDGAGAGEHLPVDLFEPIVGRIEDEAAGDANGDPDSASIIFDCETLRNHLPAPWGRRARLSF
jgi:hypothetical protein